MIPIPAGVNTIAEYPFRIRGLVVDALGKPTDWADILRNLHNAESYEQLAQHVHALGGNKIVCPKPVHKTTISSSKRLKIFSISKDQVAIYRGEDADGAIVEPGEAYALASGDCPTVAIYDPTSSRVTAMHFNRENGVDNDILGRALLDYSPSDRKRMIATVSLGIGPSNFGHAWSHPQHGENNRRRTIHLIERYGHGAVGGFDALGQVNLRWIASKKLIEAGLLRENIHVDCIDTFEDPKFWSHRASQIEGSKKGEAGRNLVLVVNKET